LSTISTTSQPDPRDSANISIPLHRRFWGWLYYGVPNLLVFSLLGSVLFFGHHTGWKMPKLSELRGTSVVASDDWCSEHLVPESVCIECNTDLLPKSKEFGFCTKHGVNECVTCHPELAQSTGEAKLPAYDTAKAIEVMARPENNSRDALHKRRIQFATIESADKSGIDIDVAQERRMSDAISANGQIMFDPTRLAHLSSRAAGPVAAVRPQEMKSNAATFSL
jgi:cobalt-zinc-cadmium efflux system membrane fusion protein